MVSRPKMDLIRSENTQPELSVRKLLHSLGFRYRLHVKELPGKPDIVFPGRRTAIFVHGCFWHQHEGCKRASLPTTNREYWLRKFQKNKIRDGHVISALENAGWTVAVLWECEINKRGLLTERLLHFLGDGNRAGQNFLPRQPPHAQGTAREGVACRGGL